MRYRSGEKESTSFCISWVYAIRGNEYEEIRGKRALPGKEKIPINTVVIVKILYRDREIVMSNIVRAIHDVVNVIGNFCSFTNI